MDSQDNAKKLPDEVVEQVSGGAGELPIPNSALPPCPNCGSYNEQILSSWNDENYRHTYLDLSCNDCHHEWVLQYN